MLGEEPRVVSVPPVTARCCTCHVAGPAVVVAEAPPPAPDPYVIVIVAAAASVTSLTVIFWPAVLTVPVLAVV